MAQVSLPYTLTAGTPENVNNLMSNLTALRDGVNTIDTAQIAANAVNADKLTAVVANAAGLNQTGVTNRAVMTAMTTERTTTNTAMTDVTGASTTFTVASGSYVLIGWNCQLKTSFSGAAAAVRVLANACVCDIKLGTGLVSGTSASGLVSNTIYQKVGGCSVFSAAEIGTGSQTFKYQFCTQSGYTASIDECYMSIIQVTI